MKKLFFVVSTFLTGSLFAQSTDPTFGIKGGLNLSSISKDGYDDTKTRTGFNAGLFANFPISQNFNIQPEVLYSQEGAKVSKSYNSASVDSKLKLDYIQVPIMFQLRPVPQFYVEVGPQFGFLASAKYKVDASLNGNNIGSSSDDVKDYVKSFNFGLGAGIGFDITENVGLNARYNFGLSDINKDGETTLNNSNDKNRLRNFQIGAYFKF